jgi:hypothetical protein
LRGWLDGGMVPDAMERYDRCVMILVDGARADVFQQLLDAGELPHCDQLFAKRGGFRSGTTVMPSVSGPAHLPMLTGAYPGRCNIPGIRWFDRARYAEGVFKPRRFRSYMGLRKVARMNRDVAPEIPSVWESFPDGGGCFAWFTRGMGRGADLTRGLKAVTGIKSYLTQNWQAGDAVVGDRLLAAARGDRSYLFAVLPTVDELSHKHGPLADEVFEAYRSFDDYLGRLVEALDVGGNMDRTLVMVSSDHGLSTTHTHFDLAGLVRKHVPRLLYFPFAWRRLFDCDAVSNVSGNGLAHLSFRGPEGWTERPDVTASDSPAHAVIEALLEQESIDLVVHREGGRIRIRSRRGSALLWRENDNIHYDVEQRDPMGLSALPNTMNERDSLRQTMKQDHPDALVQWEQLFWSGRCGDVVVTSSPGFDLRTHAEYQDHHGSHGGTWWEHMRVPILANIPLPDEPLRTVDLLPTALAACGKPAVEGMDGRSLVGASKSEVSTP